jgi:hypothetical protein
VSVKQLIHHLFSLILAKYRLLHPGLLALIAVLTITPGLVHAELKFEWDGFGTIGAGVLDDDSINRTSAFPHSVFEEGVQYDVDTRLGLQGTVAFDESLSATVQVVTIGSEDYDLDLEWAYFGYDINDDTLLRIGRMRRPLYAYSDYVHVGYSYPWARPPLEVYSRDLRFYDGLDAIDLLHQKSVGDWILNTEVYYGNSSGRAELVFGEKVDFRTRDDFGLVLEMEKDWLTLRFGYHRSPRSSIDLVDQFQLLENGLETAGFSDLADQINTDDLDVEFYNFAIGIDRRDWLFSAEYINLPVKGSALAWEETSWYLTGGRRFGPFTLHLTYAERDRANDSSITGPIQTQIDQLTPLASSDPAIAAAVGNLTALAAGADAAIEKTRIEHHSYTVGLRYDFQSPASLKIEYQRISDDRNHLTNNLFSVVVDFLF